MEERPNALLLKFPGTNCDFETARALEESGFSTQILPIAGFKTESLEAVNLVVLSGGFSYGDYVMAGRLAQLETERRVGDALTQFRDKGGYLLGICNGFQILTKLGLLPEGSLIDNTSGRFICKWVHLKKNNNNNPFLEGLPDTFELPIAHAEGRFIAPDGAAESYVGNGLAALLYEDDVNGSSSQIAGLTDQTGRVLGLMPHPERFLWDSHHYDPNWQGDESGWGTGYMIFKSIYNSITNE